MKRALRLLPLALLLAGCGMYGSLYLEEEAPENAPQSTGAPPRSDGADDADDRDDDADEEDPAGGS